MATVIRSSVSRENMFILAVTDLRIGHGLGHCACGTPRNSFLCRLITNLKSAKLRIGITSQCTWKRAKIQTSRTISLVTAALWSLVVKDLLIALFPTYMSLSKQIYSVFDADLRLVVSN